MNTKGIPTWPSFGGEPDEAAAPVEPAKEFYQDVRRDPAYDDITDRATTSETFTVPLVHGKTREAIVSLLPDEGDEQLELDATCDGDFMTGTPSIRMEVNGKVSYLTWTEAYNLGRALIDCANVALYS